MENGGAGGNAERAKRGATRTFVNVLLVVVSLAILIGWAWQGLYKLAPGESAVILRLGAYDRTRSVEGWWVHLPPPLESHVVVNTSAKRTEAFGENPTRSTPGTPADTEEGRVAEGLARAAIQTADNNVLYVTYELQYRIADANAWAFSLADPAAVLHDATEAAMRDVIGRRDLDAVLFEDRSEIEREAEQVLRGMLAGYGAAVDQEAAFRIDRINLEKPQAPEAVREAFADVVSAGQDEKRLALVAQGDAAEIVERARSQAAEIREQAAAERDARIVEARGDAMRFEALLAEYQLAPEVTRRRLYLETMEAILPAMDKAIVDSDAVHLWSSWPPARSGGEPVGRTGPTEPPEPAPAARPAQGGAGR